MFKINIVYIILSLKINDNHQYEYCILLDDKNHLPSTTINNGSSLFDARKQCIEKHTDLQLIWIDDKLLDVEIIKDEMNIYYTCSLPIETKIKNAKFIPISSEQNTSRLIQRAIART